MKTITLTIAGLVLLATPGCAGSIKAVSEATRPSTIEEAAQHGCLPASIEVRKLSGFVKIDCRKEGD